MNLPNKMQSLESAIIDIASRLDDQHYHESIDVNSKSIDTPAKDENTNKRDKERNDREYDEDLVFKVPQTVNVPLQDQLNEYKIKQKKLHALTKNSRIEADDNASHNTNIDTGIDTVMKNYETSNIESPMTINEHHDKSTLTKTRMKADVLIIGDSMTKQIRPSKLSRRKKVICKTLNGAKIENACSDACNLAHQCEDSEVIVHLGTNNLKSDESDEIIAKTFSLLDQVHQVPGVKSIAVSTIIHRLNETNRQHAKVEEVNDAIKLSANQRSWSVINDSNIDPVLHLNADGVHLNRRGIIAFAKNIIRFLRNLSQNYDEAFPPFNHSELPRSKADPEFAPYPRSYFSIDPERGNQMNQPPPLPWNEYYPRSRRKAANREFPRDWVDCLSTARKLLNPRHQ
ncbi:uncharacterized protein LOC135157181 [Lytechinus pictus]|uniref:uncharacterized protein LOC135157181 n=1 Tax=Lytechinus pictus TaxID=7653 RepID=UPI0030BA19E5